MSSSYACCAHCLATGDLGTHDNPCGYRGCPGLKRSGLSPRARTALLMALAGLLFVAGTVVAQVVAR